MGAFSAMNVLFISNLFPDAAQPNRGIFNARMAHRLSQVCRVQVIAPRPKFPGGYGQSPGAVARPEDAIFKPQFPTVPYVPKIGSRINHHLMAWKLAEVVRKTRLEFSFEVIFCAWLYPDGCAVAQLARQFKVPFVLGALGSDVHQYLKISARRQAILESINQAHATVAQTHEMARLLRVAGVAEDKLRVVYNGVDSAIFRPADRLEARQRLGLPPEIKMVLFVGNLLPIKNPLLLVRAFARFRQQMTDQNCVLIMVGEGPLREQLLQAADQLGIAGQVSLVGRQPEQRVAEYMHAADVLCVSSDNEGMPNVIYEALSCGQQVVATRVGGIPEVLQHDYLGRMVEKGDEAGMATALMDMANRPADTGKIREYALQFSWERTAKGYFEALESALKP